jgi:membrane-associated phospholipid phosphatase
MTVRGTLATAVLAFNATLLPAPALAQTDFVPSAVAPVTPSSPLVSRQAMTVAGILFAGALLGDHEMREESQELRSGTSNAIASVGNSFGEWRILVPALSAGYLAGEIAGSDGLKGTILRAGAAAAVATGISSGLKYTIGRDRPDIAGGNFEFRPFSGSNSFPSGHTAAAFAIATAVADQTTDGWSDYVLYGAATLTAMSRINDNRHWASDVLVGGLIGHLSGRWVSKQMGPVRVAPTGVTVKFEF